MQGIRRAKRTWVQVLITDPLVGLGVGFLYLILKILPLRMAQKFGGFLGGLAYYVAPTRNKIALKNMDVAFPDKSLSEKKQILKGMWRHFGMVFGEITSKLYLERPYWLLNPGGTAVSYFVFIIPYSPDTVPGT